MYNIHFVPSKRKPFRYISYNLPSFFQLQPQPNPLNKTPPLSSGGATFARTMPNCVAFGALFPEAQQTEHQANEAAVLDDLYRAMDIYAEAVSRLVT